MRFSFRQFKGSAAAAVSLTICLFFSVDARLAVASEAPAQTEKTLSIFAAPAEESQDSDSRPPKRDFNIPDRPDTVGDLFGGNKAGRSGPLPRPRPQPRRKVQRSVLDDPGNWGFATTADVVQEYLGKVSGQTPAIMRDGRDWNALSPVERYYERQMRGRNAPVPTPSSDLPDFSPTFNFNEFSLSGVVPEAPSRSGLPGALTRPTQNEALSDLLGFRNNPFSPESVRRRDANNLHMEAFRRALDVQPHQAVASPSQRAPVPSAGFNPVASGTLNNPFGLSPGAGNPYLTSITPAAPEAPTAPNVPMAPGQYATPLQQTPNRLLPSRPDFSIPQRRF